METCDGKYSESFLFWISISLRPKTETKRFNFGLSPELRLTNHCGAHHCSSLMPSLRITLLCPRTVGGGALSGHRRPSSVRRPSVCLMSRTSALTRKPKGLGRRNFAQGYPRSHGTPTPTSRSKVKVTGRGHIVAATEPHSLFLSVVMSRFHWNLVLWFGYHSEELINVWWWCSSRYGFQITIPLFSLRNRRY